MLSLSLPKARVFRRIEDAVWDFRHLRLLAYLPFNKVHSKFFYYFFDSLSGVTLFLLTTLYIDEK